MDHRARDGETTETERPFDIHELFFSTTDRKGIIRSGNDVFVRIAGYSADELVGAPHNIIRHPDMPRVVFRLLWQTIQAGEPIAAYVKNRAKDGAYYWVLATVRPIDGGYLSVRLKPSSPWFDAVRTFYDELLDIERRIERAGGTRTEAMNASGARLGEMLAAAGFSDYADFMRIALVDEVVSRRRATSGSRTTSNDIDADSPYAAAQRATERLGRRLASELDQIETYGQLNRALSDRSSALLGLADEGKVLAINAVLAARRLGSDGAVLAKVAELMKQTFPVVAEQSRDAVRGVDRARGFLAQVSFAVALAVLQNDMAAAFIGEMAAARESETSLEAACVLARCLRDDVEQMSAVLAAVGDGLADIERSTIGLGRSLDTLSAIERSGRIEATHTERAGSFTALFEHTRARLASAHAESSAMAELTSVAGAREFSMDELLDDLVELDAGLDGVGLLTV